MINKKKNNKKNNGSCSTLHCINYMYINSNIVLQKCLRNFITGIKLLKVQTGC